MSKGGGETAGSTSDPRTSGLAASEASDGGPISTPPATHGDNYGDWIKLDDRIEIKVTHPPVVFKPIDAVMVLSDKVERQADFITEQNEVIDNLEGLLRRVQASNTEMGHALHEIAMGGIDITTAIRIARGFEAA